MTIQEYHEKALREGWALGHFNISDLDQLQAIAMAAKNLKCPVLVGTSEGERKAIGLKSAVYMIEGIRQDHGVTLWLNADHSKSVEAAKAAFDAGYDSIHVDLSHLPYEENVKCTNEVVQYVKFKKPQVHVEGELGLLKGESKIQKEVIEVRMEDLVTPEQAADFVIRTGIDRLAPAVGSIHGISANEKKIYPELIARIRAAVRQTVGLTLHGGSGISNDQIRAAIKAGINNVHVNTEIRLADTEALKKSLADHPEETTPYKIVAPVVMAVQAKVEEKLKLFGAVNKI